MFAWHTAVPNVVFKIMLVSVTRPFMSAQEQCKGHLKVRPSWLRPQMPNFALPRALCNHVMFRSHGQPHFRRALRIRREYLWDPLGLRVKSYVLNSCCTLLRHHSPQGLTPNHRTGLFLLAQPSPALRTCCGHIEPLLDVQQWLAMAVLSF